ncbi:hypothetical protein [Motilimonas eburnea]|uniref:hypothetical protein n=1 Tax=Motilimonas eburnea TaxID=1737488 RepID=UPI001E335875|nr:hypothetical protein [Motilimonas eburnea]MCE2570908.1 hypothetical protein [Motilimonas eburnea]
MFLLFVVMSLIAIMVLIHRNWVFEKKLKPLSLFQFWLVAVTNFVNVLCFKDPISFAQAYPSRVR